MSGKIFVASSFAGVLPNAHTYLVYDADGDTSTFNDQYMINSGPSSGLSGDIAIAVNVSVQDPNYSFYNIDTDNDGLIDQDPEDDFNYTELNLGGLSASSVWSSMTSIAASLDKPTYDALSLNSNSVTNTVLNLSAVDFRENTPKENGVGDRFSADRYVGHSGLLDGSGDDDFTVYAHDGIWKATAFNDAGGDDTITIEQGARLIITDNNAGGSNTIILKDYDPTKITYGQIGDDLYIIDTTTAITDIVAVIYDHFEDGTQQNTLLQFQDAQGSFIGSQEDLTDISSFYNAFEELPGWVNQVVHDLFDDTASTWDPLVIDLDDDGIATDWTTGARHFDLNSDGLAEVTAWVNTGDGVLVRDVNSNGRIDNGNELFGNDTINGFAALAAHDGNSDGLIDSSDTIWADLQIWRDFNADGVSQSNELSTLSSHNITSIDVENVTEQTAMSNSAGVISHTGTVNTTTGTLEAGNYNFNVNQVNTHYVGDYTYDLRAAFLPNLRGYGELTNLEIAISLDNDANDSDSLISIMQEIQGYTFEEVFEDYDTVKSLVQDAMFRWADVENVGLTSRGSFLSDARQLEFMEKYFGQKFVDQNITSNNPGAVQAEQIEGIFSNLHLRLTANILVQGQVKTLFDPNDAVYDISSDALIGGAALISSSVDKLEAIATNLSTTAERQDF